MSSTSQIRQNYHPESEDAINKQINMELYASYVYLAMAFHFDRDDVALRGFHKFFKSQSEEETEHASRFMKFQNERGGRIVLEPIEVPPKSSWDSPLEAMKDALRLEKEVNEAILYLHGIASKHGDSQMCDFLETHYLTEQVEEIKKLAGFVTSLERVGSGLGEHVFDKEFQ